MSEQGRYKKIVVPIDGSGWSERAISHAVDIAHHNNSELILLHVFKPPANENIAVTLEIPIHDVRKRPTTNPEPADR